MTSSCTAAECKQPSALFEHCRTSLRLINSVFKSSEEGERLLHVSAGVTLIVASPSLVAMLTGMQPGKKDVKVHELL